MPTGAGPRASGSAPSPRGPALSLPGGPGGPLPCTCGGRRPESTGVHSRPPGEPGPWVSAGRCTRISSRPFNSRVSCSQWGLLDKGLGPGQGLC